MIRKNILLPFPKGKDINEIFKTSNRINKKETAFKGRFKTFPICNTENIKEPINVLDSVRETVITKICNIFNRTQIIHVNLNFYCNYKRQNDIQDLILKLKLYHYQAQQI